MMVSEIPVKGGVVVVIEKSEEYFFGSLWVPRSIFLSYGAYGAYEFALLVLMSQRLPIGSITACLSSFHGAFVCVTA